MTAGVSAVLAALLKPQVSSIRNPGDNFIVVYENNAKECLEIVMQIRDDVKRVFHAKAAETARAAEVFEKLKAF